MGVMNGIATATADATVTSDSPIAGATDDAAAGCLIITDADVD